MAFIYGRNGNAKNNQSTKTTLITTKEKNLQLRIAPHNRRIAARGVTMIHSSSGFAQPRRNAVQSSLTLLLLFSCTSECPLAPP
jgi:hypothetical protein